MILQQSTRTFGQNLTADIYTPASDTATKRPLVIYFPTGNFLPSVVTNAITGKKTDSSVVNICRRLAHMGYVTAAVDYRIGWNPADPDQLGRTSFLIGAAYRGVQDAKTAVRYFKANADLYNIDTTKIVLWGEGTGGYITLAAAALDSYAKTLNTGYPENKFIDTRFNPARPMVIEKVSATTFVMGGVEGKDFGIQPDTSVKAPPFGDTLSFPNHVANTSTFQMCVNTGGALGDLKWLDAKTPPIISFQVPSDPFAPYEDAVLRVPIGNNQSLPVVRVQGASAIQKYMDSLNLNKILKNVKGTYDPYKTIFDTRNGKSITGLYPLLGDNAFDSSPWQFWDSNAVTKAQDSLAKLTNPNMSSAKALRYIDTIVRVFAPRACMALNLPCLNLVASSEEILNSSATKLVISPNPAQKFINFESDLYNPIIGIEVYDMSGRSVLSARNINNNYYQMDRGTLPNGMYVAKVKFEGGILTKKIVLER